MPTENLESVEAALAAPGKGMEADASAPVQPAQGSVSQNNQDAMFDSARKALGSIMPTPLGVAPKQTGDASGHFDKAMGKALEVMRGASSSTPRPGAPGGPSLSEIYAKMRGVPSVATPAPSAATPADAPIQIQQRGGANGATPYSVFNYKGNDFIVDGGVDMNDPVAVGRFAQETQDLYDMMEEAYA